VDVHSGVDCMCTPNVPHSVHPLQPLIGVPRGTQDGRNKFVRTMEDRQDFCGSSAALSSSSRPSRRKLGCDADTAAGMSSPYYGHL
jgi:hypothetical protein